MWLVTIKGLLAHKLRLAMTALAVVLGVAFVAGSFILTDTIERSFQGVIDQIAGGIDLQVRPEGASADFEAGFSQERATVPAGLLAEVRDVDGVAFADRVVFLADGRVVDEMADPTADRVLERMKHLELGVAAPDAAPTDGATDPEG